jgi:ketosteroid isomerase-like protein
MCWLNAFACGRGVARNLYPREQITNDEQQIMKLVEDVDRALVAGDEGELSRILAEDYVQYDESGNASTKSDVIRNLRSGNIRYVSIIATGRQIRLLRHDVAIVHGSEDDLVEQAGRRFPVRYVYTDVVTKINGKWQIVASQLAKAFDA